jgi:small subunit ribosomal protein S17
MKQKIKNKKRMEGTVVSDKMAKTVVVSVQSHKVHPVYKKHYNISKKYKAHDPEKKYKVGDRVIVEETRPLSKDKKWVVVGKA